MVTVGVLARLEAKPGKEAEVASFLEGALPLAQQEEATTAWFATRLGPSTFGIFDVFPNEAAPRRAPLRTDRLGPDAEGRRATGGAADDREDRHPREQAQRAGPSAETTD